MSGMMLLPFVNHDVRIRGGRFYGCGEISRIPLRFAEADGERITLQAIDAEGSHRLDEGGVIVEWLWRRDKTDPLRRPHRVNLDQPLLFLVFLHLDPPAIAGDHERQLPWLGRLCPALAV